MHIVIVSNNNVQLSIFFYVKEVKENNTYTLHVDTFGWIINVNGAYGANWYHLFLNTNRK